MLKGLTRNIILLGVVSLFTDLSSQMVFPLLPLFMTTVLGTGASAVGAVEGAAESTASLLKVFSGYWSDRFGRRKPFVLFGYSLSTFTKPLFAFAGAWGAVLAIRVVERIGKGLRTAPRDALIAESCDESVRGKAFGLHRAADGVGSTLGAILAFSLLGFLDYEDIFLLAFIPGMISVSAILFVRERRSPHHPAENRNERPALAVSLRALPGRLRLYIVAAALFSLGHFGYAFLLLRVQDIGLADERAVLLYVFFYGVYTLGTVPAGVVSDRIGRKPVLMLGYSVFAATSLGLAFVSTSIGMWALFGVYGVFFALIDGSQRAFAVDLAPADLKGTALGTLHTAVGLTALPGGLLAGLIWDRVGPEWTFVYGAVLAILSVILLTGVPDKKGSNQV